MSNQRNLFYLLIPSYFFSSAVGNMGLLLGVTFGTPAEGEASGKARANTTL